MFLKLKILSWLLHHANREGRNEHFYKIKNKILTKHGKHIVYDVQFIEGKECNACHGTGIYTGVYEDDFCWHCHNGWYKRPVWNILSRVQFGKYIFHQPYQRAYTKPEISTPVIDGYIDHNRSKHGTFAITVLFILYEKGYLKRYYQSAGLGWKVYWWQPRNWIYNLIHIYKNGIESYPARKFREKYLRPKKIHYHQHSQSIPLDHELPF